MKTVLLFILFLGVGFMSCANNSPVSLLETPNGFGILRGLNASHWISQSDKRGEEREAYMQKVDFDKIAEMGFDHVRLPIDEEHMWDEEGNKMPKAWTLMHNGIKWALANDMRVIVDLHVLRSHHFNRPDSRKLWEDRSAQEGFIKFWHQLSAELKQYPNDKLAYEPLNEAVSDNPDDWNNLINWVIKEIRKLEPERTIIMGSNNWQTVGTFKDLKVPEGDPNIILSFHYYEPMLLTHYQAPWTHIKDLTVEFNYPGQMVDPSLYENYSEDEVELIKRHNHVTTVDTLDKAIYQAVEVAAKFNLHLYCGEFGCFPSTPITMRQAWYRDMMTVFEKHNIAFAHWNYKNDFPVVDENTLEPITELTSILVR